MESQLVLAPLWLLSIVLFTGIVMWLGVFLAVLPLRQHESENWMERARLAYPGWSLLMTGPTVLVIVLLFGAPEEIQFQSEMARLFSNLMVLLAVYIGTAVPAVYWATRLRGRPLTFGSYWRGLPQVFLLLAPQLSVLVLMLFALPKQLDLHACVIIGVFTALAVLLMFGGNLKLAGWLGLISPASERLLHAMETATSRHGKCPAAVYSIPMTAANAYAFPFSGVIAVTTAAMDELNDEELISVCAHELSHLTEPRPVTAVRLAGSFSLLPLFLLSPAIGTFGLKALLGAPLLMLLMIWITRLISRKMEERADKAGKAHEGDSGVYARAMEKLYRSNLMPAVMGARRAVHPHLYDRMLDAGVTPEHPRPKPPSKTMSLLAHGFIAVVTSLFVWGTTELLALIP